METSFRLTVNGAERDVRCAADTSLLEVLRHDLGLVGTRFGCGIGLCGACFVLVDGRVLSSCDLPVSAVAGPVTTVEGLAGDAGLHPVQQAFIDEQAMQCGYCISGMLMSAAGLLQDGPSLSSLSERAVREALEGNLCRCGAHGRIVRAVLRAAGAGVSAAISSDPVAVSVPDDLALPADLAANPVLAQWVDFGTAGEVTIRTGKVEYGQGIWTALAQIAAEEFQVDLARVRVAPVSTSTSPDEGVTSGSLSIQNSGSALRQACAQARAVLLDAASRVVGMPGSALDVADGQIMTPDGPSGLTYWTAARPGLLDRAAGAPVPCRGSWVVAGRSAPRRDLRAKVTGRAEYVHDLVLPGMRYGRVLRPPARVASLSGLDDVNLGADVVLVRDGSFLGVVAETDRLALLSAAQVGREARWETSASLPAPDLRGFLLSAPSEDETAVDSGACSASFAAEYSRPFIAHASMAPSCAIARWDGESVTVWCHSQGIFPLRAAIASGLGLSASQVTVNYVQGAGVYGQNGADDVALDAVLLARAVPGRPVRVQWTREDEMTWAPLGPAMVARLSADLDPAGRVVAWRQDVWSNGFIGRPGTGGEPRLLALTFVDGGRPMPPSLDGPPTGRIGSVRNAVPGYDIPNVAVTRHRLLDMPIRTSSLRSLGAHLNVFAIESFMDELAAAAGADPVAFRLAHLSDPRSRRVLSAAALLASWDTLPRRDGVGYGVGVARYKGIGGYCAAVASVAADTDVHVRSLWLAVDVGRVINPDGVLNQVEGGAVQSASWTLLEQVRFDRAQVTSSSWDTYPILRFTQVPSVSVHIVEASGEPEVGAGEVAQGPVAGAIGNAVADAIGVRVRDLPLTRERITRAIEES
jgi:CO/xanthine dehydrogenase Mo-binding subunit